MKCPLLYELCEASFAVDECNLFLDTHPCCPEALLYLKEAKKKVRAAKDAYEKVHGPLTILHSEGDCFYSWINDPWPWEGGIS